MEELEGGSLSNLRGNGKSVGQGENDTEGTSEGRDGLGKEDDVGEVN